MSYLFLLRSEMGLMRWDLITPSREEEESETLPVVALPDADLTSVGVDNPFCDRHPQAATIHLRCEKWLEDPPLLLIGQTRAVVTHGYRHRGISIEVGIDTTRGRYFGQYGSECQKSGESLFKIFLESEAISL